MQVQIEMCDARNSEFRELAETRVRFVMRRMAWMVSRAQVQLSDQNGPRGGVDKRCQVMLKTDRNGVLVIRSTASDWRSALDSALERASRLLLRMWRRGNDPARRRGSRQRGLPRMAAEN